jgi:hypothetical protein
MSTSAAIATNLALTLFLLRDAPEAREEQAAAFGMLKAGIGGRALELRLDEDGVLVDGGRVPPGTPGVGDLRNQLLVHGVGLLRIPADTSDAAFLTLLRALAAHRGAYRSLYELIDRVHSECRADFVLAPMTTREDESREEAQIAAMQEQGLHNEEAVGVMHFVTPGQAVATQPSAEVTEALARIAASPTDPELMRLLNVVLVAADDAAQADDWPGVLGYALALVEAETASGGDVAGRDYPIALRRMLPRSVLSPIARLVTSPEHRQAAVTVLRRMGVDGSEALLAHLAESEQLEERRAYYAALRQMTEGAAVFIGMLTHDEWYVVRNVADLCGDLGLEEAVPHLAKQLAHPDERVRRAVAGALAKIATPSTVEPLRQALRDEAPAVRLQAVRGIDGWRSRGLAMSLSVLLDEEHHPEIVREMLLALGRIGTPEAVQALTRAAAPGGRLFNRKASAGRIHAIEALGTVAHPSAVAALQGLLQDGDAEVRGAAQRSMAQLELRER